MPTAPVPFLQRAAALIVRNRRVLAAAAAISVTVAAVELRMGRLPFGPDGRIGLWEGNIWSREQSQRFADFCTFSHTIHGMLFYGIL